MNKMAKNKIDIDAVFFDLDDTLYDYMPCHKSALSACFDMFSRRYRNISKRSFIENFDIARNEIKKELKGTASSHNRILYFQRMIERMFNTFDSRIIISLYKTYWDTFFKNMKLRKDAVPTLKELKRRGKKIAIVTDMTTYIQIIKIKKLGLDRFIDYVVTSEEVGNDKPNPEMFLLAANRVKVSPERILMVGDNPENDVEGANIVGIHTALIVKRKLIRYKKGSWKPNFEIKNIRDILEIIR